MDSLYHDIILDHYHYPRNFGMIDGASSLSQNNPTCGDTIRVDVLIENDIISDIKFSGSGCAISQAAASILTEHVKNKDLPTVKKMTQDDMLTLLGLELSPARLKCGILAFSVLHRIIK